MWVAGKTVWAPGYRAISERFRYEVHAEALYKSTSFTLRRQTDVIGWYKVAVSVGWYVKRFIFQRSIVSVERRTADTFVGQLGKSWWGGLDGAKLHGSRRWVRVSAVMKLPIWCTATRKSSAIFVFFLSYRWPAKARVTLLYSSAW